MQVINQNRKGIHVGVLVINQFRVRAGKLEGRCAAVGRSPDTICDVLAQVQTLAGISVSMKVGFDCWASFATCCFSLEVSFCVAGTNFQSPP